MNPGLLLTFLVIGLLWALVRRRRAAGHGDPDGDRHLVAPTWVGSEAGPQRPAP